MGTYVPFPGNLVVPELSFVVSLENPTGNHFAVLLMMFRVQVSLTLIYQSYYAHAYEYGQLRGVNLFRPKKTASQNSLTR